MADTQDARALQCRCGGSVSLSAPRAACGSCGTVVAVDDLGVCRLTPTDQPWTSVPDRVADAVRRAPSTEQLVDAMVDEHSGWPVELQRRLLHPASGGMAVLVEPPPGATALDLCTGWATLPVALSSLGTSVVTADWIYLRLRLGRLLHDAPSTVSVHIGVGERLPWADASFDVVFLDLEEVERLCQEAGAGPEVKDELLAEVRRVLRDDGTAVVGTRNRLREVLRAEKGVERRHRPLQQAWRAASAPWSDPGLRRAGLVVHRVVLPFPTRAGWRWLIPGAPLRDHGFRSRSARGRVVRLVVRSGLAKWLVRDHYVLARPSTCTGPLVRTLGEALVEAGEAPPVARALSDARVALLGRRSFIKLPLSRDQQRALVSEVDKTQLARGTAFAPWVVPASRVDRWRGIPYSVSPAIPEAAASETAAKATVHAALSALDASALAPLHTTTCWRRLSSARGRSDAEEIGAAALRAAVLEGCRDDLVPVGPSHGDLHPGNVLVRDSGPALLVDWNRFELSNPLLLDAVYAAARAHQASAGTTFAQSLLSFVDGRLTDPVAVRAVAVLGQLSPLQGATVVLLDRVVSYSLPRRRHKPWTMPPLREAVLALTTRQGGESGAPLPTATTARDTAPPS